MGWTVSNRNTPTCVGKTLELPDRRDEVQKHPHVRGEDILGKPFPKF